MAKVLFTRTDANDKVETIPFKDGQIIYTKDGKTYLDYGTDRIELVSGGDTIPIGSVMPFAEVDSTSALMSDWLLCDGSAVSRTLYSELFSLIGTTYGAGDGSTTFNLPDVKGRVIVGQDEADDDFKTLGAKIGEKEVTLTIAQMPRHNHGFTSGAGNVVANQLSTSSPVYFNQNDNGLGTTQIDYTGGGQAHNNIQPSLVLKYYIKTFRSASLTADVKNAKTISTKDTYSCDYTNEVLNSFNFYLDSNSVTIEPKVDVYALVEASWGIWGFAGAEIGLIISTPEGATQVDFFTTHTNGHDTEAVPVTAVGKYILPAGGKYTFGVGANTSLLGGVKGNWIKAITIPKMD